MHTLGTFHAALRGDDAERRDQAGPDALIHVVPELFSAPRSGFDVFSCSAIRPRSLL